MKKSRVSFADYRVKKWYTKMKEDLALRQKVLAEVEKIEGIEL